MTQTSSIATTFPCTITKILLENIALNETVLCVRTYHDWTLEKYITTATLTDIDADNNYHLDFADSSAGVYASNCYNQPELLYSTAGKAPQLYHVEFYYTKS